MPLVRKLAISYFPRTLENGFRICATPDELTQVRLGEKEKQATPHSTLEYGDLKSLLCVCDSDGLTFVSVSGTDCIPSI